MSYDRLRKEFSSFVGAEKLSSRGDREGVKRLVVKEE